MAKCKNCMHCIKMELETYQDDMGAFSEWMCECYDGSWHPETDDSNCPEFIMDLTRMSNE